MKYVDNFKRFIEYMDIEVVNINPVIAEQGAKIRGRDEPLRDAAEESDL